MGGNRLRASIARSPPQRSPHGRTCSRSSNAPMSSSQQMGFAEARRAFNEDVRWKSGPTYVFVDEMTPVPGASPCIRLPTRPVERRIAVGIAHRRFWYRPDRGILSCRHGVSVRAGSTIPSRTRQPAVRSRRLPILRPSTGMARRLRSGRASTAGTCRVPANPVKSTPWD